MAKEGGVIRSGLKLGVAAAVVLLVAVGLGRVGLLPSISNPFRPHRERGGLPSILHEVEDASEYTAASANVETSFEIEDESVLPDFLLGESVTFQAYGSVDGVVDFTRLTEDAIVVDGDRVTVTLPEPRLDNVHVDPDQSQVLDTDRGLLDRIGDVFPDDAVNEEELYSVAEDRLVEAATDSDLLDRARPNSPEFIEGLVTGLGYEDVRVVFETPNSDQT